MKNNLVWGLKMALLACGLLLQYGCSTPAQTAGVVAGVAVGTTILGAYAPGHEIEQVYYLGVFDPQEQVPPTVYRITVHGQASAISRIKFGSGWVPAQLIDSLSSHVGHNVDSPDNNVSFDIDKDHLANIQTGRRMIEFGPEGFREAPKDHRLVIVMGSSPKNFFEAIDQALGSVPTIQEQQGNLVLQQDLFKALVKTQSEREALKDFEFDMKKEFP